MRIEYTAIDEVSAWPRNPKDHDLNEIKNSFVRFGFVSPVVIDEKSGHLVAGHGRVDSLKLMRDRGMEPPSRVIVENGEWKLPVLRGIEFNNIAEAEAYILADNRISEIGGWDKSVLDVILEEMADVDGLLEGTGFDIADALPPEEKYNFKSEEYTNEEKENLRNGIFISVGFCDVTVLPSSEFFDSINDFAGSYKEFSEEDKIEIVRIIAEGINAKRVEKENRDSRK